LKVVQARLKESLEAVDPDPVVLSLCAGDGRDIVTVLRDRPNQIGRAVLVELDPALATRAERAADSARLSRVEVRCQDAGAVESFIDVLPVDVLLLCGIFGNIDHSDVKNVIERIPCLVKKDGYVIWTRGSSEPDWRPEVRRWFIDIGLEEVAFDGAPEPYGVGLNRMVRPGHPNHTLPPRLFNFA
jgi:hypothetical protein